jgi:lysophospholipase L1-like esterase
MTPSLRIISLLLVLALALASWTVPASGQSPSAPVETRDPEVISVVGLGDSFAGGLIGCLGECRSFVQLYGGLVEEALGRPVAVTNLATSDGLESGGLLSRVKLGGAHRMALAGADVITVMIGWNDWQGPCFWEGWDDCFAATRPKVEANLTAILDEISLLREGQPTVLRVVTYYDPYVGWSASPGIWGFDPAETATFEARFDDELTAFNAMLCSVAESHGGLCVDTRTPINGRGWDVEALPEPAEGAIVMGGDDHLHPVAAGHQLIARAIADLGFAPLAE